MMKTENPPRKKISVKISVLKSEDSTIVGNDVMYNKASVFKQLHQFDAMIRQ